MKFTTQSNYDTVYVESWLETTYSRLFMNFEGFPRVTTEPENYQVLCIYQDSYEEYIKELALLRYQQGWWVKMVPITDITAANNPDEVKDYIYYEFDAQGEYPDLSYIMLYGSEGSGIPYFVYGGPGGTDGWSEYLYSYPDPDEDLPQLMVGRVWSYYYPQMIINSIIEHETQKVLTPSNYYKQGLFVSGFDEGSSSGHSFFTDTRNKIDELVTDYDYTSTDLLHLSCSSEASSYGLDCACDYRIEEAFHGGLTFAYCASHGGVDSWRKKCCDDASGDCCPVDCSSGSEGYFSSTDVNSWTTTTSPYHAVGISYGCRTARDLSRFLTKKGILAYYGKTSSTPTHEGAELFLSEIISNESSKYLGNAWLIAITPVAVDKKPFVRLYGDPLT